MKNFSDSLLEQLKDKELAVEFLLEALENPNEGDDDIGYLLTALGQVAKAQGIDNVAAESGIPRSTIYQIIREDSNPTLRNVSKILKAVGIKLSFEANNHDTENLANVLDVAAYIIEKLKPKKETTFWLQKLVYYSQVTSLLNFKMPLFSQKIEAWANGPVVKELFDKHRGVKTIGALNNSNLGDSSALSKNQKLSIDWALDKYASLSGEILSDLTHSEQPWNLARGGLGINEFSRAEITNKMLNDFYLNRPDYADLEEEEYSEKS
ncbi:MAG: putative addiction module antidote protein [Proteobacteria bacterium]|nr:MAG: putative addiction module antidote protein [Pseudomonadota bacterium]